MQNNAEEKGKFYVQTLENAVNTYCDMYKTNEVTLGELKSEGLFKESSNGVRAKLENTDNFFREDDGTVKFKGQDLKITVKINETEYTCDKTKCVN